MFRNNEKIVLSWNLPVRIGMSAFGLCSKLDKKGEGVGKILKILST